MKMKNVNVTRMGIIGLYKTLEKLKNQGDTKFKYAILKNLKAIEQEVASLRELEQQINDAGKEYNDKKNAIITKYGTQQEDGYIRVEQDNENYSLALSEIETLNEEYKDQLLLQKEKTDSYMELLNENYTFEFNCYMINESNLPDNLSTEELESLITFEII